MKTIRRALLWSISLEVFVIFLAFGGYIGLSFLPYLALAFHFPALSLLDYWPAVRQTFVGPILIQWFIWFILFVGLFRLRDRIQRHTSRSENDVI
jgi:hypothetical protein